MKIINKEGIGLKKELEELIDCFEKMEKSLDSSIKALDALLFVLALITLTAFAMSILIYMMIF